MPLSDKTLTLSDLPANYSKVVKNISSDPAPCAELYIPDQLKPRVLIAFDANGSSLEEGLAEAQQPNIARTLFAYLDQHYSACHSVHPISRLRVSGTGRRISFPTVGEQSQVFSFTLTYKHTRVCSEFG